MSMRMVFQDGTEARGSFACNGTDLWISFEGLDIATVAEMVLDTEKTQTVSFFHDAVKDVFHGYVDLWTLKQNILGNIIDVQLRGNNTNIEWEVPVTTPSQE